MHTSASKDQISIRQELLSCCLGSCQTETDLDWLRNHVKVVGERKILASLVEFKHNLMAETIRKEHEEKKTKVKAPVMTKQDKKHQTSNNDISVTAASAALILTAFRSGLHLTPVKISAPPRLPLRRYSWLKFGVFYLVSS